MRPILITQGVALLTVTALALSACGASNTATEISRPGLLPSVTTAPDLTANAIAPNGGDRGAEAHVQQANLQPLPAAQPQQPTAPLSITPPASNQTPAAPLVRQASLTDASAPAIAGQVLSKGAPPNTSSNIPATSLSQARAIPPMPVNTRDLRDGPECDLDLSVTNQTFFFSKRTVSLLRESGARPWVFIRHDVNRSGNVINPVVVRSAGIREYDADALRSLQRWKVQLPPTRLSLRGCMAKFAVG